MKLAFVSTYPPTQCGIGIYTRKLARALAEGAHPPALTIVAERDGYAAYDDEGIRCEPIYERGEDYVEPILGALRAAKIEIVHFQHAPDLFGEDARFVRLLAAAQAAGIATVITPHTVHGESHRERHRQLGAHADALIAHQQ
ncbi:MAG: hypothetical protein OEY14_10345, partial [Myxococcales bacterium]|nr:hypothetical protein [Myxococcales bacterium]